MEVQEAKNALAEHLHEGERIHREVLGRWDQPGVQYIAYLTGIAHTDFKSWISAVKGDLSDGIADLTPDAYPIVSKWNNMAGSPWSNTYEVAELGVHNAAKLLCNSLTARINWLRELRNQLGNQDEHVSDYFVEEALTTELQEIDLKNQKFDLTKVIELCRELNVAKKHQCSYSILFLIRTLMDHIPPIFSKSDFNDFANQCPCPF